MNILNIITISLNIGIKILAIIAVLFFIKYINIKINRMRYEDAMLMINETMESILFEERPYTVKEIKSMVYNIILAEFKSDIDEEDLNVLIRSKLYSISQSDKDNIVIKNIRDKRNQTLDFIHENNTIKNKL